MRKIILSLSLIVMPLIIAGSATALSDAQRQVIAGECDTIHRVLESLQKTDSKTRVKLGYYYETILSKFMIPLNSRLVKNSISNSELINIQTEFKEAKQNFSDDFVAYQKNLEALLGMNCNGDPDAFYEKIVSVRSDRAKVRQDTVKLKDLITKHRDAVKKLMERLWQEAVKT